jgi:hypothetical protein
MPLLLSEVFFTSDSSCKNFENKDGGVKNTAAERQSLNYAKLSLL